MIANKVTRETLTAAATEVGVSLDITTLNARGTRHRVKVNPGEERLPREKGQRGLGDRRYQRVSAGMNYGRRVHAVCWHGFRDFFRAVYRIEPAAVFHTAMDSWRGSTDFEERFPESGHKNIGSNYYPTAAAEACRCPESGYAR